MWSSLPTAQEAVFGKNSQCLLGLMLFQMNLHGLPVVPVGSSFGRCLEATCFFFGSSHLHPLTPPRGVFKYAFESNLEYFLLFGELWLQVLARG